MVKNALANAGDAPLKKEWQLTPSFLPEKFHGHRSLKAILHGVAGKLDTT